MRWVTWDKMSNKGECTFPYGGMGWFKCTFLLRTVQEVRQNKRKLCLRDLKATKAVRNYRTKIQERRKA